MSNLIKPIATLIFFFLFYVACAQRQHLLHENTFEESTVNDAFLYGWINNQHCCSYSMQRSNEVTGIGSYVLRLEVRSTDASTSGSIRSEIVPDDEPYALNTERWYGFKMYLKDWADDNDVQEHVWQWHPEDGGSGASAALSLWTGAGKMLVVTNDEEHDNVYHDDEETDVVSNEWIDYVIHVKWTTDNTGLIEIWQDGTKIIDLHDLKTAYVENYFKLGINKFGWPGGSITNRTLYFDEVRIGNENATYSDVAPDASTPTATATLNGIVQLQGRPSPLDEKLQVPIVVKIYSASNSTLVGTYNVTTSRNGRFVITGITPGTYHIAIKNSHTLQRVKLSQILVAYNNEITFDPLFEGDADNDNQIDNTDLTILTNSFNKGPGDPGYDIRADFNGDTYVELSDFSLISNNYLKQGESITPGCPLVTATITNTIACNGEPFDLVLSSATGTGPFDLVINGTTYSNIAVSGTVATIHPPVQSVWNSLPGVLPASSSAANIELGAKFRVSHSGFVKGIRFLSADAVSGTYTGSLWSSAGTQLATATFSSVTANAWQQVLFSTPVYVNANTTYVASYHTTDKYVATISGLCSNGFSNGDITILQTLVDGGNGQYKLGSSAFPDQTSNCSNYWVDVMFVSDAPYTYNLTSATDDGGCNNTRDMQTLTVTSSVCGARTSHIVPVATNTSPGNKLEYSLEQNYPNPFRGETVLKYAVPETTDVNLSIYDIHGRVVKVVVNGSKTAGTYTMQVNTGLLKPGVYYYKLKAGNYNAVRKMIIQ